MKQIYPPFEESQLLKYLLGQSGEEERSRIEEWLFASEDHRSYLDQIEHVWVESGKIKPAPVAVDVDVAWDQMLGRISGTEKETPVRSLRYVWTAAAILLVSFGIYGALKFFLAPSKTMELTTASQVLHDTLPDGTTVALNKNTRLEYPEKFDRKKREVSLSGEAFFQVAHNAANPFIVKAGQAQIKVLGTAFNVKAYSGSDVEVTVEQGLVMLFTIDKQTGDTLSLRLSAGLRGVLPAGSMQPQLATTSQPDRLFWLDHQLEFNQTSLSEVFSVLSGQFGIPIRTTNPQILNCRLTATFRNESLETILEVIATSFELNVKHEANNWVFYGKGCSD